QLRPSADCDWGRTASPNPVKMSGRSVAGSFALRLVSGAMADHSLQTAAQPAASLIEQEVKTQLTVLNAATHRKYARFFLAALSSVPWVGGLLSATASLHGERDQGRVNGLHEQWIEEHQRRLE